MAVWRPPHTPTRRPYPPALWLYSCKVVFARQGISAVIITKNPPFSQEIFFPVNSLKDTLFNGAHPAHTTSTQKWALIGRERKSRKPPGAPETEKDQN